MPINLDNSRDDLLTDFGKETLKDRYLMQGESYQDLFARVSTYYSNDEAHAQRLYDYMSKLWFMPSTPILSNGGTNTGLPISCFLNSVEDSMDGISNIYQENIHLAKNGGGIGTYFGDVRSLGEKVGENGKTSGIIPFIVVQDALTLAVSQGGRRRGSAAVYIDVHHPEIEEFLEIRKPSGDFNRKSLNLHHGINIDDKFMEAVIHDKDYALISPKTKKTVKKVNARVLFEKILETRIQTGEPYTIFIDNANKYLNEVHKKLGLKYSMSNLCSEIFIPTGIDHLGKNRTAVCCLSSLNAETWDEWKNDELFIEDVLYFLDNVLEDFIKKAPDTMSNAVYSCIRGRDVGLGLMGFHYLLQQKNVPFASPIAKAYNNNIFKHIKKKADEASIKIGKIRGACEDAKECELSDRFMHKLSIAPTASISIIAGGTSACIEPLPANIYTHKTLSGSFSVRNKYLEKVLIEKGMNNEDVWLSIINNDGSVQHLDFLNGDEKNIFKTAFEIDQRWIIELAGDRTPYVCQGQSINLFLPADIHKRDLLMLHFTAWKKGIKSLYYCRSKSIQRTEKTGNLMEEKSVDILKPTNYDECLACQ